MFDFNYFFITIKYFTLIEFHDYFYGYYYFLVIIKVKQKLRYACNFIIFYGYFLTKI